MYESYCFNGDFPASHVSELRGVSLLSNIGYYIKGILAAPPKATPPVIRG